MGEEPATNTYLIAESFERAVKSLRKALIEARLQIVGELNMSRRIHRQLGMNTAPCVVLFASLPAEGAELLGDPGAMALTPLHIVISERGGQTEMHVMRFPRNSNGGVSGPAAEALKRMQAAISRVIERIGMRVILSQ